MPERDALCRCHACDAKVSSQRLRALLRRRALERFIRSGVCGHEKLARRLRDVGFHATRNLVAKDMTLLRAVRLAETAHAVAQRQRLKEPTDG